MGRRLDRDLGSSCRSLPFDAALSGGESPREVYGVPRDRRIGQRAGCEGCVCMSERTGGSATGLGSRFGTSFRSECAVGVVDLEKILLNEGGSWGPALFAF